MFSKAFPQSSALNKDQRLTHSEQVDHNVDDLNIDLRIAMQKLENETPYEHPGREEAHQIYHDQKRKIIAKKGYLQSARLVLHKIYLPKKHNQSNKNLQYQDYKIGGGE